MSKKIVSEIVLHSVNGNEEQSDKFVEVDGKKFVDDGSGKPKVGEDGKPVPFEEKKAEPPKVDLANAGLEELAKVNPHVAKMLADQTEEQKKAAEKKKEEEENQRKEAEKNGEWQKLADEFKKKNEDLTGLLDQKNEQLGKYVKSVETILAEVLKTIPKENLALVPDKFSPREKLEYITQNAKLLGAKIIGAAGGKIENNDTTPTATDEDKLVAEIDELKKKGGTRTASETELMLEKAKKLKEIRTKKAEKK